MKTKCCAVLPYQVIASLYYAISDNPKPYLTFNDMCWFCDAMTPKMPDCLVESDGIDYWTPEFYGMPIRITFEERLKTDAYKAVADSFLVDFYNFNENEERYINALKNLNAKNPVRDEDYLKRVCNVVFGADGWKKYHHKRNSCVVFCKDKDFKKNNEALEKLKVALAVMLECNNYKKHNNFRCAIWGVSGRGFGFDTDRMDDLMKCIENATKEFDERNRFPYDDDNRALERFVNARQSANQKI